MNILSIDGGGVRGIIPMLLLIELEKKLDSPIHNNFDLICGTSIGGIIASAITTPDQNNENLYNSYDVYKFFDQHKHEIFDVGIASTILSFLKIKKHRYNSNALYNLLELKYEDKKLSDTLTDIVVPSVTASDNNLFLFSSKKAKKKKQNDFYLKDVAYSAVSAETFFKPKKVENVKETQERKLVDATKRMNNPSLCAITDIIEGNYNENKINIVSIGTSKKKFTSRTDFPSIAETLFNNDVSVFDCEFPLLDSEVSFSRLNPDLKYIRPNDISAPTIHYLYRETRNFIKRSQESISKLTEIIQNDVEKSKNDKTI